MANWTIAAGVGLEQTGVERVEVAEHRRRARRTARRGGAAASPSPSGARLRHRPSSNERRGSGHGAVEVLGVRRPRRVPISVPVDGSMIGIVSPDADGTSSPSITWPKATDSRYFGSRQPSGYVDRSAVIVIGRLRRSGSWAARFCSASAAPAADWENSRSLHPADLHPLVGDQPLPVDPAQHVAVAADDQQYTCRASPRRPGATCGTCTSGPRRRRSPPRTR